MLFHGLVEDIKGPACAVPDGLTSSRHQFTKNFFSVLALRKVTHSFQNVVLGDTVVFYEAIVRGWTEVVQEPWWWVTFYLALGEVECGSSVRGEFFAEGG